VSAQYPGLPSETPRTFKPPTDSFDYVRREEMIAMRDGVKLHTVILVPKGAKRAPILLTRTPYNADTMTARNESTHLRATLDGYDHAVETIVEGGYIRVVQDARGKHGSEGDYVMNRPVHGPQNPTPVDHATDTYDTIDWLVKNVKESNGKVGIIGISYDGFTPLMAVVHPHPALKVSVPMNPMVDGWRGDDWFHNGAFRQTMLPYIYDQEATRKSDQKWPTSDFDEYQTYLDAGTAGELARRRGLEQVGFWNKILAHPAYDAFWKDQAVDRVLAAEPLKVPVLLVHSLWDQEDIYGAMAVYKALEPKDKGNDKVFLVLGPWRHGQAIGDGSALGDIRFDSDTSLTFRRDILLPFLDHYLKDNPPKQTVAPVMAFETGTNKWRALKAWPAAGKQTPLYLRENQTASFTAPTADGYAEYVSDPAKPVPYIPRPVVPNSFDKGKAWREWLVTDQREPASRPDVLVFQTDVLAQPIKISGEPLVNLVASTSGSDSDWVVKLIDVYPPEVNLHPELGGYQLAVAMDIFRGRYREGFDTPRAIAANQPLVYKFALPNTNHVFLPGHRIMVQVQSSWFPLYDRNPQTFVPSIFTAKPSDFKAATQRIYHSPKQASFIALPVAR
ncbi:MAG TPA: CocE/NonD family hydrolase, partial [Kofleriaceae bacterium]|nr:CocE/NonD family hydrolase [Kofleriaceae bacterium]